MLSGDNNTIVVELPTIDSDGVGTYVYMSNPPPPPHDV